MELPVFHLSPVTLQEMTASLCALDCWRKVTTRNNRSDKKIRSTKWIRELPSPFICTDIEPFPAGVRSIIDHKIRLIRKELEKWWVGHPPLELSPQVMVNCVVLNPAGDICYKKTAKNLLTANTAFSLMEQFEIACTYCFEEDVQRLWISLEIAHNGYYNAYGFHSEPILSLFYAGAVDYWCSKMRGELQELYEKPNEGRGRSPEWFVLSNRQSQHTSMRITNCWAHVEYFWHKLNREEQSSLLRDVLLDEKFTKHLILKLDDAMLGNLPRSDLNSVFDILAENELCYESALQLWSYVNVKNIIIEDMSLYCQTLANLSKVAIRNPNFYGFHISSLLKEMWLSASIDFKNYLLSEPIHFEELFERILKSINIRSFGCDVGFLIKLLSGASFETRQHIWHRWWHKFFLLGRVSDILKIMTLCFNNADDIVQFKKNYMLGYDELSVIFTEFSEGGFFDELTDYLKFCCSDDEDEKLVREARKKFVLQNFNRITYHCSERIFCKRLQFFHDSVSSADLAELLNWEFQDKEANLLAVCILYRSGELYTFNKALRYFEFPDQRVIELKRFFYERCQYVLTSGDFNSFFVQDWEGFLLWCASSAENVNRLRDSIAIDDLFENLLINMHKFFMDCRDNSVVKYRYSHYHVFNSIDRLLVWYFRDREDATAKQFKRDKIIGHENSEAVKMFLNMEFDETFRCVLLWFFNDERRELRNFLVQLGDKMLSRKGFLNFVISF